MTNFNDPAEPADLLLHDLRRFLHNAHDQQVALSKISKAMAGSTSNMEKQGGHIWSILQSLQKQIKEGVVVHIDADLKAHIADVSKVTAPLVHELQKTTKTARHFIILTALAAFLAGVSGAIFGVFAAFRLM